METQLRASVELCGSSLRYVVLERQAGRSTLRRLGSCDFEFDLDEELRRTSGPGHLDLIQDALADVLAASAFSSLSVTLHPPTSYAFKTPLPETMSAKARTKHLKQEASLLLGMMPSDDVHVDAQPLRAGVGVSGEPVEWMHVSALNASLHWRLSQMVQGLPVTDFAVMDSPRAIARLLGERSAQEMNGSHPYMLLLGCYADHSEYVLLHQDGSHHDTFSQTVVAEDVAYFTGLLGAQFDVDPEDVGRVFLFGPNVDSTRASLSAVFERTPEVLDPIAILHLDASDAEGSFQPATYAPCLGGAL